MSAVKKSYKLPVSFPSRSVI